MDLHNNSFISGLLNWMREHRIISAIAGCFLFIFVVVGVLALTVSLQDSSGNFERAGGIAQDAAYNPSAGGVSSPTTESGTDADIPGVEIKKGSLSVDSQDAEADEAVVRVVTESYGGYIEEGNQSETNTRRRIHLTTRVPADSFSPYIQDLRSQLNVEDYQIRNYRIEIQEQTTELDILADTLSLYEGMKQEVQTMPVGEDRIELTMDITDRQLELKERENHLQSRVDRVTRQGDMATVQITLEERLSAEIWPEDLGNDFRDQLRDAIQNVVDIAIAIVTTSLVVFMTVLQWAIWLLIALVVLWFAWRLLRRLYKRWYE